MNQQDDRTPLWMYPIIAVFAPYTLWRGFKAFHPLGMFLFLFWIILWMNLALNAAYNELRIVNDNSFWLTFVLANPSWSELQSIGSFRYFWTVFKYGLVTNVYMSALGGVAFSIYASFTRDLFGQDPARLFFKLSTLDEQNEEDSAEK